MACEAKKPFPNPGIARTVELFFNCARLFNFNMAGQFWQGKFVLQLHLYAQQT